MFEDRIVWALTYHKGYIRDIQFGGYFLLPLSNVCITILISMVKWLILLIWFHHMDTILVVLLVLLSEREEEEEEEEEKE